MFEMSPTSLHTRLKTAFAPHQQSCQCLLEYPNANQSLLQSATCQAMATTKMPIQKNRK